jgi:hypothetical protein
MKMTTNETNKEKMMRKKLERKNRNGSMTKGVTMTKLKTVKLEDIKTPKTVEEFRENLRKYVCGFGTDGIYVQGLDGVPIDEISFFADIYTLTKTGFGGDGTSPNIVLTADWSFEGKGGVSEYMSKTKQNFSCDGYWEDEDSAFTIYEGEGNMCVKLPNPVWGTLDNQVLRELYVKLFGDFSGYVSAPLEEVA